MMGSVNVEIRIWLMERSVLAPQPQAALAITQSLLPILSAHR